MCEEEQPLCYQILTRFTYFQEEFAVVPCMRTKPMNLFGGLIAGISATVPASSMPLPIFNLGLKYDNRLARVPFLLTLRFKYPRQDWRRFQKY